MGNLLQQGHRERLRKRYLQAGTDRMPDYDVLELLLTYAVARKDVKAPARELLRRFGDVAGIMEASVAELTSVPDLGERSAVLIVLLRDLCCRYLESKAKQTDVLDSMESLKDFARMKLASFHEEVMMLVCLNAKNFVISSRIVAEGTVDSAIIYPRNIAVEALQNEAVSVILIHNHPSGIIEPSRSDRMFTKEIRDALRPLDIRLLDHLIVSRSDVYSFLEHGLLEYSL